MSRLKQDLQNGDNLNVIYNTREILSAISLPKVNSGKKPELVKKKAAGISGARL